MKIKFGDIPNGRVGPPRDHDMTIWPSAAVSVMTQIVGDSLLGSRVDQLPIVGRLGCRPHGEGKRRRT